MGGSTACVEKATKLCTEKVNFFEDMQVAQSKIPCILGKSFCIFNTIQAESGARIWIDQSTQHLGYSIVRIKHPGTPQHAKAKAMIMERIGGELFVGPDAAAKNGPRFVDQKGMKGGKGQPGKGAMPSPGKGDFQNGGGSWDSSSGGGNWGNQTGGNWGNQQGGNEWGNPDSNWNGNWNGNWNESNDGWNSQSSGGPKVVAPRVVPPIRPSQPGGGLLAGTYQTDYSWNPSPPPMEALPAPVQPGLVPTPADVGFAPAPADVGTMDPIELMLVGEKLAQQGVNVEDLTPAQLQEYVQNGKLPTYSL